MTDILKSYEKSKKVIESCSNELHLQGARNYITNFFKANSIPSGNNFNLQQFYVDDTVVKMYNELALKLREKQKSLSTL